MSKFLLLRLLQKRRTSFGFVLVLVCVWGVVGVLRMMILTPPTLLPQQDTTATVVLSKTTTPTITKKNQQQQQRIITNQNYYDNILPTGRKNHHQYCWRSRRDTNLSNATCTTTFTTSWIWEEIKKEEEEIISTVVSSQAAQTVAEAGEAATITKHKNLHQHYHPQQIIVPSPFELIKHPFHWGFDTILAAAAAAKEEEEEASSSRTQGDDNDDDHDPETLDPLDSNQILQPKNTNNKINNNDHTKSSSSTSSSSLSSFSVVFYGCSHLRELYFALIRLQRGQPYNAKIEHDVMYIPSCDHYAPYPNNPCIGNGMKFLNKYLDKPCGIKMNECGLPGKRLVPELSTTTTTTNNSSSTLSSPSSSMTATNINFNPTRISINDTTTSLQTSSSLSSSSSSSSPNVAFGFKSFLHSPDADELFLDFLIESKLRHPTVVLVDFGIWGPRHQYVSSTSKTTNTPLPHYIDEINYYFSWIKTTFPNSHIVYVYDNVTSIWDYNFDKELYERMMQNHYYHHHHFPNPNQDDHVNNDEDDDDTTNNKKRYRNQLKPSLVIRKDRIIGSIPGGVPRMPCGHGCAGPVMEVMARLFLGWLQQLLLLPSSQQ